MLNPIYLIDFYKVGHVHQYPSDTRQVWSNWTPRATRLPGVTRVVSLGMQYFIKQVLLHEFDLGFFWQPWDEFEAEYKEFIQATLGVADAPTAHIKALHDLGHLPIEIYAIPEGRSVPLNCPMAVITNTDERFYWLPNYLETVLSNILWKPSTSATMAREYKRVFEKWARKYGCTDLGFTAWQGHDFSFRGMSGREDAILSGLGHLATFNGTDTVPAIWAAHNYYGAALNCGGSVPATEHSVMCAGGKDGEFELFKRLITEVYPTGVVSIVSDTWDLWKVCTQYIPQLREVIQARKGKVVVRPDSGDPVKILCGDPDAAADSPARYGVLRLLQAALGLDKDGLINGAAAIYGDSITLERADTILQRTVEELHLNPYNVVFGIGSFTYEYVTRDTHYFAMKATAVRRSKGVEAIFKDPVTDDGRKRSHKGIVAVYRTEESTEEHPDYFWVDGMPPHALGLCAFERVFKDGKQLVEVTWGQVRERVAA